MLCCVWLVNGGPRGETHRICKYYWVGLFLFSDLGQDAWVLGVYF